jgi:hypothetical protein
MDKVKRYEKNHVLLTHPFRDARVVKRGFNFGAFFLTELWAYSEGLAKLGGRLIAISGISYTALLLAMWIDVRPISLALIAIGFLVLIAKHLTCGIFGNEWKIKEFESQGFKIRDVSVTNQ